MRLTYREQSAIVQALQCLYISVQIYLYGSGADDSALGGATDVLLLSDSLNLMGKHAFNR